MLELVEQFPLTEEYNKKTGITPQDIAKLRSWLQTQPHLPAEAITDLDLILTYHCCNRSSEVSKQLIDLHFTLRTLFYNFFKNRLADEKTLQIMKYYLLVFLEEPAHDGARVLYTRLLDYDVKNFVFHEAIKSALMVLDLWQYMEGTWAGMVLCIDLDRVSLAHITRLDIQSVQQLLYYLQEAMLLRLKGIHFLNAPSFMDRLMMIIRPFMKKELLEILHIHQTGSRTLDRFMPMEALPKEAGGQYLSFESAQSMVMDKISGAAEYFSSENKKRVLESARPGKPKTISDIFGSVEGSFKKLDID